MTHQTYVFVLQASDPNAKPGTKIYITQDHLSQWYWCFDLTGETGAPGELTGHFVEGPLLKVLAPANALWAVLLPTPGVEGLLAELPIGHPDAKRKRKIPAKPSPPKAATVEEEKDCEAV